MRTEESGLEIEKNPTGWYVVTYEPLDPKGEVKFIAMDVLASSGESATIMADTYVPEGMKVKSIIRQGTYFEYLAESGEVGNGDDFEMDDRVDLVISE